MHSTYTLRRAIINGVGMAFVSGLSLFLLIYVGHGEARRTYQQFQVEKLVAQGQIIQKTMDTFLRGGHSVKQFVGFNTKAGPILASDPSIAAMSVFDQSGQPVFIGGADSIPLLPMPQTITAVASTDIDLRENEQYLQIVLPLRNRFEQVGSLAVSTPKATIVDQVMAKFRPLLIVAAISAAGYGLFVAIGAPFLTGRRERWLQYGYALTFLGASIFVVATLISLYSEGAQAKTKALADSFGERLNSIVQFGLNITEIDGLDQVINDYQRLNPDISAAGLMVDGIVKIHTDKNAVGRPWKSERRVYEYIVDLTPPGGRDVRIAVATPSDIVYRQILRSVKNFAAVFVASAFAAGIFLQLAGSVRRAGSPDSPPDASMSVRDTEESNLKLVKPVFFIAIVSEHLSYAFLPQFMYQVVEISGMHAGSVSLIFMVYYLCFALSLVPAGHFAQHFSPRPLMYLGMLLAAVGLGLLVLEPNYYVVLVARALSGVGQGMLFIGVQSYILATAAENRKTQGAAIIVFGFQGGMISGMAIGSLLVTQMGPQGVFALAALMAALMALYTIALVPKVTSRTFLDPEHGGSLNVLFRDLITVLRNFEFLRTMFLVGVPAKAVLTGVIIFGLPILMTQAHYAQEDIGQVLMVYAGAVVLASGYASRAVDHSGRTTSALFFGSVLSGGGLVMIGLTGWTPLAYEADNTVLMTLLLITGVAIVGIAHGYINAPVVTHVANSELAATTGETSATAAYRFLERIGHVAGPLIVGQLFIFSGQNPMVVAWIGGAIALLGVLFLVKFSPAQARYS
ncbi:MAG: MFS transporter [Alphaproteobacteria bacterium]|nr:MFS transporter [Alphaproteobacteria bacterium]